MSRTTKLTKYLIPGLWLLLFILVVWQGFCLVNYRSTDNTNQPAYSVMEEESPTTTERNAWLIGCPLSVSGPFNHEFSPTGFLRKRIKSTNIFSDDNYTKISIGGRWTPKDCKPVHEEIAVIVPIRGREQHLEVYLSLIHPFLQMQKIPYTILTVEQVNKQELNKGSLFNVGVLHSPRSINCFILADVYMIPNRLENMFTCDSDVPKSLSTSASQETPPPDLLYSNFGSVVALTREQYYKINGFSTFFWGWGEEDNDLYRRAMYFYGRITRVPYEVGVMTHLSHSEKSKIINRKLRMIGATKYNYSLDGFRNTMDYCRITQVKRLPLRTAISVECVRPPESVIEKVLNITL